MKKVAVILIVLGLLTLFAGNAAYTENGKSAAGLKVGVIDLNKISENYESYNHEVEKVKAKAEAIQEEILKITEKMKALQERRELFEEGSDEYDEINDQIEQLKLAGYVKNKSESKKIEKKQVDMIKGLYKDIRTGVQEYSDKHKFDLIVVESGPELMGKKLQDIVIEIRMKPVVYSSNQLDITDNIIEYLNTEYKK